MVTEIRATIRSCARHIFTSTRRSIFRIRGQKPMNRAWAPRQLLRTKPPTGAPRCTRQPSTPLGPGSSFGGSLRWWCFWLPSPQDFCGSTAERLLKRRRRPSGLPSFAINTPSFSVREVRHSLPITTRA
jgi:hypothetical protein